MRSPTDDSPSWWSISSMPALCVVSSCMGSVAAEELADHPADAEADEDPAVRMGADRAVDRARHRARVVLLHVLPRAVQAVRKERRLALLLQEVAGALEALADRRRDAAGLLGHGVRRAFHRVLRLPGHAGGRGVRGLRAGGAGAQAGVRRIVSRHLALLLGLASTDARAL